MAGTIVADTIQDGAGNSTAMDNAIYGSAKAWVNYNAISKSIRASYNVSSVTYTTTGTYVVNFTNALPSANYNVVCSCSNDSTTVGFGGFYQSLASPTTTSATMYSVQYTSALRDYPYFCASFFN